MRTPGKPRKPRPLTGSVPPRRSSGGEAQQSEFLDTSQDSVPTAFVDPLDIDELDDEYEEYDDDADDYDDDDDADAYDDVDGELDSESRNPLGKVAIGIGERWHSLTHKGSRFGSKIMRKIRRKPVDEVLEDDEQEEAEAISPAELSERRRERAAEQRRIRLKRLVRGVGIILGVLLFLWVFFFSSLLRYEYRDGDIAGVTETSIIDKQKLADALRGFNGYHILLLDNDELNTTVKKAVPEVAKISAEYRFPNSLSFTVVPQKPVACVVNESACQAIAYDGTQLNIPEDQLVALPHIGELPTGRDPKKLIGAIIDILGAIPEDLRALVSQVTIDDHAMVTLSFSDGHTVRWGANDDNDHKLQILRTLLTQNQRFIDVSAPSAPVTSN